MDHLKIIFHSAAVPSIGFDCLLSSCSNLLWNVFADFVIETFQYFVTQHVAELIRAYPWYYLMPYDIPTGITTKQTAGDEQIDVIKAIFPAKNQDTIVLVLFQILAADFPIQDDLTQGEYLFSHFKRWGRNKK